MKDEGGGMNKSIQIDEALLSSLIPPPSSLLFQTLDKFQQRRRVNGLCQMSIKARLEGTPAIIESRKARDGDHRDSIVLGQAAQGFGQLITVHPRHPYIRD